MKKKFSVVEGSSVREESRQELSETLGYGVVFLKTRAADSQIREMQVPIWKKTTLTVKEAAYSNIGINRNEEMLRDPRIRSW
jgi:hypothetical protein